MPFALLLIGLIALVSAVKGTHRQLGQELVKDFTGPRNFTYWVVALIIIGSIGYVKGMEKFSRLFLVLVLMCVVILNKDVMHKIKEALDSGPMKPTGPVSTSADVQRNAVSGDPLGNLATSLGAPQIGSMIGGLFK